MGKIALKLALISFVLVLANSVRGAAGPATGTLKVPPELLAEVGITADEFAAIQEAAARGEPHALKVVAAIREVMALDPGPSDPLIGGFSYGRGSQPGSGIFSGSSPGLSAGNSPAELWTNSSRQSAADSAAWLAPMDTRPVAAPGSLLPHASSHPTRLTAVIDDREWPVIRVKGTSPVVLRDKKEKSLWQEPVYSTERADRFAPGWVEVKDLKVSGVQVTSNENITGTAFCSMTLTATMDLKGAFVAVLVFDADFIEHGQEWPNTTYRVHDLPDLPKGKPVAVEFTCKAHYGRGLRYFVPLIFAQGGAEVSTSEFVRAKIYFTTLEKNLHTAAVRLYRAQNTGDHEAAPFERVNPILPEAPAASAKLPVAATLAIDESGHVTAVKITTPLDPVRTDALDDALRCWSFLPKLKAGKPVATSVQVIVEL